jgi:hypothetical protein
VRAKIWLMDQLDEITLRMRLTKLQAILELREIDQVSLNKKIASGATSPSEKQEAIEERSENIEDCRQIREQLKSLKAEMVQVVN